MPQLFKRIKFFYGAFRAVNYEHNVSTAIYKMISQIEKQIGWLEEKK